MDKMMRDMQKKDSGKRCGFIPLMLLVLVSAILLSGFGFYPDMPFNGDIRFHDIGINIPETYIRDSTQSNDDQWIFEKDWYSSYIMLFRSESEENASLFLNSYSARLRQQGIKSRRVEFLEMEAIKSSDLRGEMPWRELAFAHNDSIYFIALRGGAEEDFDTLLESINIPAAE